MEDTTTTPLDAEGDDLLRTWRTSESALSAAVRPTWQMDRARDQAWERWAEYTDEHHRCQTCGVGLVAEYPWANCYLHEPDDHRAEWDAYLAAGKVWP